MFHPRLPDSSAAARSLVLADTLRIGALTGFVKLAGLLKMTVIARFFGADDAVDAYLMAFLIPAFVADSLAGAILPSLLPILIEARDRRGAPDARRLYANVLLASAGLLATGALLAAIFATPLVRLVAPGFSAVKVDLTSRLLLLMLPVLPLSAVNVTWRTLLNAGERFATAAMAPVLTPLTIVAAIFWFGHSIGIFALAIGTTAGAFLEAAAVGFALRLTGARLWPSSAGRNEASGRLARQYSSAAAGNLIYAGSPVVDQILASSLTAGSVSILSYGTRLAGVLLSIGPASLSAAAFPRFSRLTAAGDWKELLRTFRSYAVISIAATVPLTAALMFWSEPLARRLFERGAFTPSTAHAVAIVQLYALLQLPLSMPLALLVRLCASLQANGLLLGISALSLAANLSLDLLLMRSMGVAGIALGTALAQAIVAGFLIWKLKARVEDAVAYTCT